MSSANVTIAQDTAFLRECEKLKNEPYMDPTNTPIKTIALILKGYKRDEIFHNYRIPLKAIQEILSREASTQIAKGVSWGLVQSTYHLTDQEMSALTDAAILAQDTAFLQECEKIRGESTPDYDDTPAVIIALTLKGKGRGAIYCNVFGATHELIRTTLLRKAAEQLTKGVSSALVQSTYRLDNDEMSILQDIPAKQSTAQRREQYKQTKSDINKVAQLAAQLMEAHCRNALDDDHRSAAEIAKELSEVAAKLASEIEQP